MKIYNIRYVIPTNKNQYFSRLNNSNDFVSDSNELNYNNFRNVQFQGLYDIKTSKKIHFDLEKNKLIKIIEKLLNTQSTDFDMNTYISKALKHALAARKHKEEKLNRLYAMSENVFNNNLLSGKQKHDEICALKKEIRQTENIKTDNIPIIEPIKDEDKFDYKLLNIFRNAVLGDNYDFAKIYKEYYSELNNINTIEDLKKKYPKLNIPEQPENIIAQKLVSTIDRDFYLKIDELFKSNNYTEFDKNINAKIYEFLEFYSRKYNVSSDFLYDKIAMPLGKLIIKNHIKAIKKGFHVLPDKPGKTFDTVVTDTDIKMITINYDEFVIKALRQQHLDDIKLDDIIVETENEKISLKQLKNTSYKFEKINEKYKKIISMAEQINYAQKDYDNYTEEMFHKRLNYYANNDVSDNENILESIINFETCKYLANDKKNLIYLLRELDKVKDGLISREELGRKVVLECIRPVEAEKAEYVEQQKLLESAKKEHQKAMEMEKLNRKFDKYMNILYANNITEHANIYSKYRQNKLTPELIKKLEFIFKTIDENMVGDEIINKKLLMNKFDRYDAYEMYKDSPEDELYKIAIKNSKNNDGTIDIDKFGQRILNLEIIKDYPKSKKYCSYPEILDKIVASANNEEDLLEYLCKLDAYETLSSEDKTHFLKIKSLFNDKDNTEKIILKHIFENDYINTDTTSPIINSKSSNTIYSTIKSSAKKMIYENVTFPQSINLICDFEKAMTMFATFDNSSGIKQIGTNNNSLKYKQELKLVRRLERLFSSQNNYIFDIFDDGSTLH